MVKEYQYTSINRVLDNLHDDPMMQNLTLEQVVRHAIRFIEKNGLPKMFQNKQSTVEIHKFRGILPCDLISIIQVKDSKTGICLRSTTDNFNPDGSFMHQGVPSEHSFKTQGKVIFTSFSEGEVEISYKSIPVDENGFPLLIDNEVYLSALEAYITMKVLQQKFRRGDVSAQVYNDAQTEYCWEVGQLNSEFMMPSQSELESMARTMNTMIPKVREFDNGFKNLGDREYLRKH